MPKQLNEGEVKRLKVNTFTQGLNLVVVAECVDDETPYIMVEKDDVTILTLTDVDAHALAQKLTHALKILPSSK